MLLQRGHFRQRHVSEAYGLMGSFADLLQIVQKGRRQLDFAVGPGVAGQLDLHLIQADQLTTEFDQRLASVGRLAGIGAGRLKIFLRVFGHGQNVVDLVLHGIDAHPLQGRFHKGSV